MAKKRKAGGMYPGIAGIAASTAEKAKEQYYRNLASKYTKDDPRMTTSPTRGDVVKARKETEEYLGLERIGKTIKKKKKKK